MRIAIMVLLSVGLAGCDGPTSNTNNYPLEHKIAIVNAGHYVPETDITVTRIRFLLASLQTSTGYSQEKIADQAAATRNLIRENFGRDISILDLLEAANNAESLQTKSVKLEEYFAIYATMAGQ